MGKLFKSRRQNSEIVKTGRFVAFGSSLALAMGLCSASLATSTLGAFLWFVFKGGNPMITGNPFLVGVGQFLIAISALGFVLAGVLVVFGGLILKGRDSS